MGDGGNSTRSPTGSPSLAPTGFVSFAPSGAPTKTMSPTYSEVAVELQEFVESPLAKTIAFGCAVLAILIAGANIFKHLVHYREPGLQKNIVRILFMVPFYAMFSFLSLAAPSGQVFLDSIRDVYEAFVVYCFLNLMLSYCGGENACLSVIMNNPGTISHVFPLNWCLPVIPLNARFLRSCKQGTLQFVIIKPIMAGINLFMIGADQDAEATWEVVQSIVYNISYTLALYMLVLFYKATHEHPGLKGQHPVLKFLSVKLVVFATYYQSVLVSIVPGVPEEALEALNSFILCCEMVVFAMLQYCAFSWREFAYPGSKSGHIASRRDSAFDSIGIEIQQRSPTSAGGRSTGGTSAPGSSPAPSPMNRNNEIALSNAKDVISMKDVASDAYYNFNNKYGDHVLLDTTGGSTDSGHHHGFEIEDDDDEEAEKAKKKKKKSRNPFGSIGTTIKSLKSGVVVGGEHTDIDLSSGSNPFEAQNLGGFGQRSHATSDSFELNINDGNPTILGNSNNASDGRSSPMSSSSDAKSPPPPAIFDPHLPTYVAEMDNSHSDDNPFAKDISDPFNIHSDELEVDPYDISDAGSMSSPNASTGGHTPSDWTADFTDEQHTTKTKKKKKKKKSKEPKDDQQQLALS